ARRSADPPHPHLPHHRLQGRRAQARSAGRRRLLFHDQAARRLAAGRSHRRLHREPEMSNPEGIAIDSKSGLLTTEGRHKSAAPAARSVEAILRERARILAVPAAEDENADTEELATFGVGGHVLGVPMARVTRAATLRHLSEIPSGPPYLVGMT